MDDSLVESPLKTSLVASAPGYVLGSIGITVNDEDTSPWTNSKNCFDVNGDDFIDASDILSVMNYAFRHGNNQLPAAPSGTAKQFVDVNGNGANESLDILLVINYLFRNGPGPI